jgi:hypothetical protein
MLLILIVVAVSCAGFVLWEDLTDSEVACSPRLDDED